MLSLLKLENYSETETIEVIPSCLKEKPCKKFDNSYVAITIPLDLNDELFQMVT